MGWGDWIHVAEFTDFVYYVGMINSVELSKLAKKQLRKVPRHVVDKLLGWIKLVEREGLREARRIPGYHDEPLRGSRRGQRSIRLSKAYRAIYRIRRNGRIEFVRVEEVSKHGY
jgi:proteic killer suppression protein